MRIGYQDKRERRERIATAALAALIAETPQPGDGSTVYYLGPRTGDGPRNFAVTALLLADALIAELDRKGEEG